MFYGLKEPGKRRRVYEKEYERMKPWKNEEYKSTIVYELDNGKRFEVRRIFEKEKEEIEIRDAITGENLTSNFEEDKARERKFALEHIGLDKTSFMNTALVRQSQIDNLFGAQALTSKLQSLADTGSEEYSAKDAIEKIQAAIDELGTEKATAKPLGKVVHRLRKLEEEEEGIIKKKDAVSSAINEIKELKESLDKKIRKQTELKYVCDKIELGRLDDKLRNIAKITDGLEKDKQGLEELDEYASFPVDKKDTLVQLITNKDQNEKEIQKLYADEEGIKSNVEKKQEELKPYEKYYQLDEDVLEKFGRAEELKSNKEGILRREIEKRGELIKKREEVEKVLSDYKERLGEFVEKEDLLTYLQKTDKEASQEGVLDFTKNDLERERGKSSSLLKNKERLKVGIGTAIILVVIFGVSAFLFLWMLAPFFTFLAVLYILLKKRKSLQTDIESQHRVIEEKSSEYGEKKGNIEKAKEERAKILKKAGVQSVEELTAELNRIYDLRGKVKEYQSHVERTDAGMADLQQEIKEAEGKIQSVLLTCASISEKDAVTQEVINNFRQNYKVFKELDSKRRKLGEEKERLEKEIARKKKDKEENQKMVDAIMTEANVATPDDFFLWCEKHEKYNRFAKDKSEAEKSLELLLEGKIIQYWNDKCAQLAERIKSLDEEMPRFVNLAYDANDYDGYKKELEELEKEISDIKSKIKGLESIRDAKLEGERELPEVEEEIELCKEELKGLKRYQKALNTAKDIIEEVTKEFHSQVFAPELNRVMSELIQKVITKYDEVKIEQDLSINVRIPEIDSIKKIEDFGSKGVIDQFYFVLRVAIAKLLTKDGETLPLILDDPFESFDDNRLREALDFLIDLSTKNQVILLTCHQQAQVNELKKQLQAKDVAFQENDVGELKSICT